MEPPARLDRLLDAHAEAIDWIDWIGGIAERLDEGGEDGMAEVRVFGSVQEGGDGGGGWMMCGS